MEVTVEKLGPCQAKVQFTVPSAEFQAAVRRQLVHMSQNVQMKGFRPGKVPPQVIEKQYGKQVRGEAIEHFVRQAYEKAVGENKFKVVGFQRVNLDDVKILEGVDWTQSFEVSLRPEIELGTYKGIEVESELEPVMGPEIADAIANLKQQQSRPEPAGADGLPADGMAVVKISWLAGTESVLERDGIRISPKAPTPGTDPAAFERALTGAKDGDTRDVEMTFPAEFEREDLRGTKGTTRIVVTQAYRMIPPTDDEVQKMLGVEGPEKMKTFVREKLEEAKAERENTRIESLILDKLIAQHTIDLPTMMVEEQTRVRIEQLKTQMKQQGADDEAAAKQAESQRQAAHDASERGLRALFLVQTIGEKEKLLVTREDMDAELAVIAERNKATIEEVRKYYEENRLFDQMAIEILERKVRRFLREQAKITTPT